MTLEIAPRVIAYAETHGHLDPRGFVEAMRAAPRGEAWDALIQVVTVGETYFCRHHEQLDALSEMCRRRFESEARPLAIWSAGCATGEEPYSLAMLLEESSVPFEMVGSDVDAGALTKARAATGYSDRAVAHMPPLLRERWLEPVRPGRWRLQRPGDLHVRFVPHNLIQDAPLHPRGGGMWDMILCRNVLLYFAPKTGSQLVARLGRTLHPGGGLWVGPCDHVAGLSPDLGWAWEGDERYLSSTSEERRRPRPPLRGPRAASPTTAPLATSAERLLERGLHATARRAVEERLLSEPTDGVALALLGAFHLREHAFDEAIEILGRAADAHPKPEGVAYLLGVAHLKAGRSEEAATAFATALEDDPDDWASSYQLAVLYRRSGRLLREEVMLLRTADRLGAGAPRRAALGAGALLVNSVHGDPALTRRLVDRRLAALGIASAATDNENPSSGRPS